MEVVKSPWDGKPTAVVDESGVGQKDYKTIRERKLAVWVRGAPFGDTSLDFLLPIADELRELSVTDLIPSDISAVGQCEKLEKLFIEHAISRPLNLSKLVRLRHFEGNARRVRGLSELHELRELHISLSDLSLLAHVAAPLRALSLLLPKRFYSLPEFGSAESIEDLKIYGGKGLDIRVLERLQNLRRLELHQISLVTSVSALSRLPRLRQIYIDGVAAVDDPAVFAAIAGPQIFVDGKHPFDGGTAKALEETGRWVFAGDLSRFSQREGMAGREEFVVHPALAEPMPAAALDGDSVEVPESWVNLGAARQRSELQVLWGKLIRWAAGEGANVVVTQLSVDGPPERNPLSEFSLRALEREALSASWLVLQADDEPLLRVLDSIEDGVRVFARSASELNSLRD